MIIELNKAKNTTKQNNMIHASIQVNVSKSKKPFTLSIHCILCSERTIPHVEPNFGSNRLSSLPTLCRHVLFPRHSASIYIFMAAFHFRFHSNISGLIPFICWFAIHYFFLIVLTFKFTFHFFIFLSFWLFDLLYIFVSSFSFFSLYFCCLLLTF